MAEQALAGPLPPHGAEPAPGPLGPAGALVCPALPNWRRTAGLLPSCDPARNPAPTSAPHDFYK
jgi:hypothetical protein